MEALVIALAVKYPWIVSVILISGTLRMINKPLFSLLRKFVLLTPTKSDDMFLDEVERSKTYIVICYLLDWFASIKIGPRR